MTPHFHQKQKTIAREGQISGVGLHSGQPAEVILKPAAANTGISFYHDGVFIETLGRGKETASSHSKPRCSLIGDGKNQIMTVEHLLASLQGLGIHNILVDVHGPEIPSLDGSALLFVEKIKALGIVEQNEASECYAIREPIFCHDEDRMISIYPAADFSVSYLMDYDFPYLRNQKVDFVLTPELFETQIAPARTFCTSIEAQALQEKGIGLGANHANTVVVFEDGSHQKNLRFPDECARHKVLDILGDLNLLGFPITGKIVGVKSGHSLNRKLVDEIRKQKIRFQEQIARAKTVLDNQGGAMEDKAKKKATTSCVMDLNQIKKVLPHRYPFLLVDKIVEMSEMNIVGIKNVTGNEHFFQGHFPDKAVMPGVLIIEALAQTGGILMLSKLGNQGKLAYLVTIDGARFRKMVLPGDQLRLEIQVLKMKAKIGIVKGVAKVDGEEACSAEMMYALGD